MIQRFKIKVRAAGCLLLCIAGQLVAYTAGNRESTGLPQSNDTAASRDAQREVDFVALPNPVRDRKDRVILMCRTRCIGTARVTIYDAVGSMVFQTTIPLRQPNAMGHKLCIPWDCRNLQGRIVGNGTYLGVISLFDKENRPFARHMVNIGIAYH